MRKRAPPAAASCNPIAGAKVKIWHTQLSGSYSGDTPNPNMCLKSSAEATKHSFRGVQTTDSNGRVDFDSCFPGWYKGDQTLVTEIFTTHPEYSPYGTPDTTNANDNVVGKETLALFLLEVAKMADGAMQASKLLVVPI